MSTPAASPSLLRRFFSLLAIAFRWFRALVLNLLFLLLVLLLVSAFRGAPVLPIPPSAVLLLNPSGALVEQRSVTGPEQLLAPAGQGEVVLSELLQVIRAAAEDTRIQALVLQPEELGNAAFSHLQEVARALQTFKAAGKPLYAVAGNYSQGQYYLASVADEIMLNPLGSVGLEGFGTWQLYFQAALEKLGVQAHVFRVGTYKAAVEPYERNDMSPEAKSNFNDLFGDLWEQYLREVEAARELPRNAIPALLETYDQALARYQGDGAALALGEGLVDRVESLPASEAYIDATLSGDSAEPLPRVDYQHYLRSLSPPAAIPGSGRVGLIMASGEIVDGEALPGAIGGDTLATLIREARDDENLAALVLRIDSPGGSAFASEVIRGELEAFKQTGRPLVISMGSLAASGGYWIATPADEIWASGSTITGSIGIYGVLPTFEQSFAKLGLAVDGTGTTSLSGGAAVGRPLSPLLERSLQLSIEHGYQRFITLVSEARGMDLAAVDNVAQGQVWSGMRARDLGLVDEIGDLDQALGSAAELAGLLTYTVVPLEVPLSPIERLLVQLSSAPLSASTLADLPLLGKFLGEARAVATQQSFLQVFEKLWTLPAYLNDPNAQYLHCEVCAAARF